MYLVIPTIQLAVLSSMCRELHAETALLPFSLNTFTGEGLPCGKGWKEFLETTSPDRSAEEKAALEKRARGLVGDQVRVKVT
jgi:hypothetical protein